MTMKPGCTLLDGVEANRRAPATFHIPDLVQRRNVPVGGFAKIGVKGPNDGPVERFWVKVQHRSDGHYQGVVSNDLVYIEIHGLDDGDPMEFSSEHVLDIDA